MTMLLVVRGHRDRIRPVTSACTRVHTELPFTASRVTAFDVTASDVTGSHIIVAHGSAHHQTVGHITARIVVPGTDS